MKSIEDVLGKDYVQKAINDGVSTTLLEGEALHKVGVSPDVLNEDQKFALQKYTQINAGKFQSSSKQTSEPLPKDLKESTMNFLNDNSLGRGLGSLLFRYALTANALSGNTFLNEEERNYIIKYQEMVEKKKEEKNASFLSPARKKAIEDLKLRSQNAQGFAQNLKAGAENVFDTLTHPREWTTEGIIDNIADPVNLLGFGVGNIAGKVVSRIAPKIANSLAAKMAIGGVAGSVEGGGVNALQSLGEELGKGKTLTEATKSATQALSAGALAGGVLGSAGGGAAHTRVPKDTGDFTPKVGFKIGDRPKYEDLSDIEKENIKNEILNNELLKNESDPIVSTKIKDNADHLHQKSVESLKSSIEDLALAEEEAKAINLQAKELALAGVKDLDAIEVSDRSKAYTQIINDGNSVLDPRLEGIGILHTLEDNIKNPLLSPDEFFNKLKQKGVTDELAKITTEGYVNKNPNILQHYIEDKLTQATEAKIAADVSDHIQAIPDRDLGRVIKNSVVVDDRAGVNEPVVYKVISADELKPMFKSGEGTQHRFADNTSMISRIVNDFNPDLHFGREGGFDGVPIVDYEGHIVTGNHRASAIQSMYSQKKADPYIEGIKKYYGEDVLEGIKDPVLVRELLTHNDDKIQRIAKVSNEGRENSIADSLITNGAKIEPYIDQLPPIINNNFELANYLHIQGVNDQAAAQGLLSYINPKIAHYVDSYLKNKRNDPRVFGILIDNAYLFWNAKTYAKAPNMEGVDISNLLHTAIERLSVQKEPTAKKELERVLDHYSDAFLNTSGQKKFSEVANVQDLKGELLGILLFSLVGRKDGGREAFKERFDRAIGSAKFNATPNLLWADANYDPKQTQWDMLSYLLDTSKEDEANADFSSNLLNSKYEPILKDLIRVEKEKENDPTIHMAGDPANTEPVSASTRESEQVGGATIPIASRSVRPSDRQGGRSDLSESKSATDDNRGGIQPEKDRGRSGSSLLLHQPQDTFGTNISEAPSIERFLGDDTLFSREGDDRALPRTEPVFVSSDGSIMREQLEGNGTDRGEGIQQFLDEGRDGGADSRSSILSRQSNIRHTLSDHTRGDSSDRAGDQGIQREDGDKRENEGRAGVGGHPRHSLQQSVHLPVEDFGTNYPEYYHDGKGAIEKLLQEKQGQVQGAFYRSDIGDITLVWGKEGTGKSDGFGLSKIAKFHPEVIDKLDELISTLPITKESPNRYQLENEKYKLAIRKEYEGDKENWVLTAFEKDGNSVSSRTDFRNAHTQATDKTTSVRSNINPTTEKLKNQELKTEKISEQLSEELKEAYNKYESTKSTQYQETKEIEKSDDIVGLTANVYTRVADEIMSKNPLELALHNNWVKETIKDPFGINFKKSTFKPIRGKEALETLLTYKLGQVKGAFYKEGLGDIDLVWGNEKMGLAHILEKHPEVIDRMPEIIEKGEIDKGTNRVFLNTNDSRLAIALDYKGEDKKWIITAYDKDYPSSAYPHQEQLTPTTSAHRMQDNLESNPNTEQLKNQELVEEIQQEALDLADKSSPTQDTQPYLPLVESVEKRVLQNKAEAKKDIIFNDLEDIKKDLPYLLKEQAEDVKFAEQRFSTGGRGVLFTNGTGTGKTFTGLGIAKRKLKMGAKNILILTQSTQKNLDWKKEGKILNMDIVEVNNTKENPNGVIIATYANFRENTGLNSRTYDLIIYDESQSIIGSKEGDITEIFQQHQNISIWNYLPPDTPRSDENFYRANELAKKNQVVFLSATPFASHKALRYGEGLLFDGRLDNEFLMNNFGYTIRYSKLTYPQRGVDVGQLERDFADNMANSGVKRGRRLMSDYDYNRAFMKVDGGLGKDIDRALEILDSSDKKYQDLYGHYRKKFNYHYVNKISESIKAKETLEFVKGNLEEGRKVVIFHSYNEGGVAHPFIENFSIKDEENLYKQYKLFKEEYPQFFEEMDFENPLNLYKKELGGRVDFYNGRVSKKNRSRALDLFNDDSSGVDVLVVQIDAGGTGISLHDRTGIHPRVALKLNIPTKPIVEIQSEGRVYRTGQKSNTAYVYPVTHLGIEQRVFGSSINERIGTVENLALGSEARNLKDTFKQGYLEAREFDAKTLEFTGGKDYDRAVEKLEPYAKAINDYFAHTSNKYDGVDYFPTPEPIGYKMSKWADVLDGESILEPSAGSGSIARYFSEGAKATAIEPSSKLFSKLQVNMSSENPRLLNKNFEDLNPREKFDGVVMNPPFGVNSVTAASHLKKALNHLNSGGRVVALVPSGNSMMKHLENLGEFTKDIKKDRGEEFKIVAEVSLPSVTFKKAGTNVNTKILIIDKTKNEVSPEVYDFSHIDKIEDLFVELGNIELPKRERVEKLSYDEPLASLLHNGVMKANEKKLSVSIPVKDIERSRLNEIWKVAKDLGGMYVRGKLVFPNAESFKKFVESEDC